LDEELKRIAERIRSWRDESSLTLQQLGDRAGVSASTIHKIENLQTVPTIAVLLKIANGLNRRPSELLADGDVGEQLVVLRLDERQRLSVKGRGELEHLNGMIPHNRLDSWRVRLEPGRGPGVDGDPWHFDGEVVLVIEDGRLDVEIAEDSHVLGVGDSIHFDSSLPHSWYAGGGSSATVLVMLLLPERLQGDLMSRIATLGG